MTHYGKYGNVDVMKPKDWQLITTTDSTTDAADISKLGDAVWNAQTSTCTIYSSVLIKIVYAGMGFRDNT
jgi:hypothetical protein